MAKAKEEKTTKTKKSDFTSLYSELMDLTTQIPGSMHLTVIYNKSEIVLSKH